ncbi:hypothetical protein KL930_001587 [Ogataea haglerorum]|uniref:Uncharacterized protein n=1 Tax=Ogataea haglerorum TaxID=1937702 RepID=A0AAN6HYA1_9ASCO|nr:hypothetical protein KL951_002073 [Ogataea haglerorum]KAG7704056.1 hypothetical protein KL950_004383 [Ogataea haglerorum]KAG7724323.1 hypothetical protein KL933_004827 [Ogataea haglerorum]KAG7726058.1 hypothetical protein KL948_004793 [Ogataea haglerorum]KAG7735221.1 hypothetical protein KL932_004668 [Ogataea haglerorum]
MAAYIGVYSIVLFCYGSIVYVKSFQSVPETRGGLIKAGLDLLPLLVEKVSRVLISCFHVIFQLLHLSSGTSTANELLVAYAIVSFRKIIALVCWAYITQQDDNSVHMKAFLVFCVMNITQNRFILKNDTVQGERVDWKEGLASFVATPSSNSKREGEKLHFRRNTLFAANALFSALLFVSMFKYYSQFQDNYYKVMSILIRLILVVDMEFLRTLCDEFVGLDVVMGGEKSNV